MSGGAELQRVHDWFLHRGLPLVLTRRVRSRGLVARSAPMVSAVGALTAVTMMLADFTGGSTDYGYVLRLGIIAAVLVAAPFALYLLHRTDATFGAGGRRTAALLVMAIFVVGMPVTANGWSAAAAAEASTFVIITLLAIWLTYIGFRVDRGMGLPVRLGAVGRARHVDEPAVPAADVDRGRLLHR